ncbi:ABC transporter permease [uncultured Anaerococcus sp.]|uniref:ABC transporter permease n=1 Tax=uncultured Anaerococcus sp. TaxID=293428 RepID=UPI00262AA6BE|nr:ABC transporter permease [uncultured Anaerococcus sp.]
MYLALKEMKKEKGRYILIISIFLLISYLVYFLTGLSYGLAEDNKTAIDNWQASQIILSKGSNSNLSSSMINKDDIEEDLKDIDHTLINLSRSAAYKNSKENEDNLVNITLIGMDSDSKSFPKILDGNDIENDDEIIASSALKDEEGLKIGDTLKLSSNDKVFKIVGFTDDYKYSVSPVIYTKLEQASPTSSFFSDNNAEGDKNAQEKQNPEENMNPQAMQIPEKISAALVYDEDKFDLDSDYDLMPIDDFIEELPGYRAQILTFDLMIGFLIVIAAIVIGVFLYIITIQKKNIFGIMKIQGISSSYIGKSVILQTLIVSLIGLAIGLGLTYLTEAFLPITVPFKSNPYYYAIISILILITSQIGAFFSVRSVSKVDPLEVI